MINLATILLLIFVDMCRASTDKCKSYDPEKFSDLVERSLKAFPCVRLFHRDGDIGCRGTKRSGVSGATVYVSSMNDITKLSTQSVPSNPTIVTEPDVFGSELVEAASSISASGILVLYSDTLTYGSPASTTPRAANTPDASVNPTADGTYAWNPSGSNLLDRSWGFPVFALGRCDSIWLRDTIQNDNALNWPRYTVHMDDYMGPNDMDSVKCLSRGACQPLGGFSVWASKGETDSSDGKNIVVVASAMDATSMFHDLSYGAETTLSSLIALLAAADALKNIQSSSLSSRLVFAAFQSEMYGFSGSRKFVDEISSFTCNVQVDSSSSPTKLKMCANPYRASLRFTEIEASRIERVLAIDQIGFQDNEDDSSLYYVHEAKSSSTFWSDTIPNVSSVYRNGILPPTSASSFLNISGLDVTDVAVLSGYNISFGNRTKYSSQFDVTSVLNINRVANVATLLARGALKAAGFLSDVSSVNANTSLVENLVRCFGENPGCDLFERYTGLQGDALMSYYKQDDEHVSVPLYVSVYAQPYIFHDDKAELRLSSFDNETDRIVRPRSLATPIEIFVRNFLADVTSDTQQSFSACGSSCNEPDECIDSKCVPSPTSYYHSALDPAFNETSYAKYEITGEGPAYTEPYWSGNFGPDLGVKIYLADQGTFEWVPFMFGLFFFMGCFYASTRVQREMLKRKLL